MGLTMDTNASSPDHDSALLQITQRLGRQGLQAVRSLDVQTTGDTCPCAPCDCHNTPRCHCQLTVMLVYGLNRPPVTLLARRIHERTWFSLVNTPQQPADPDLEAVITAVLAGCEAADQSQTCL